MSKNIIEVINEASGKTAAYEAGYYTYGLMHESHDSLFNFKGDLNESVSTPKILNEGVYFGKTDEVLEIEKLCTEIVKRRTAGTPPNNLKARLEKAIKKFVNCEDVCIEFSSFTYMTMYPTVKLTDNIIYSSDGMFGTGKRLHVTPRGGAKFVNPKGKVLIIHIPFVNDLDNLTGPELCAVLLHEIGHNMDFTMEHVSLVFELTQTPYALLTMMVMERVHTTVSQTLGKKKWFQSIMEFFGLIVSFPLQVLMKVKSIIYRILPTFVKEYLKFLKDPLSIAKAFIHFDDERYADSFAAAYGYTTELDSALRKTSGEKIVKDTLKNPIIKFYTNLSSLVTNTLFISPHMSSTNRLVQNIKYLRSSIGEIEDPKMKQVLMKNIEEAEELLVAYAEKDAGFIYDKVVAQAGIKGNLTDVRAQVLEVLSGMFGKKDYWQRSLKSFDKEDKK